MMSQGEKESDEKSSDDRNRSGEKSSTNVCIAAGELLLSCAHIVFTLLKGIAKQVVRMERILLPRFNLSASYRLSRQKSEVLRRSLDQTSHVQHPGHYRLPPLRRLSACLHLAAHHDHHHYASLASFRAGLNGNVAADCDDGRPQHRLAMPRVRYNSFLFLSQHSRVLQQEELYIVQHVEPTRFPERRRGQGQGSRGQAKG